MPFIRAQSSDPRGRRGRGKKSTRRLPTCKGPLRHKRAGPRFAHWAEAPFRLSPFTCFTLPPRSARLVPRLTLHYSTSATILLHVRHPAPATLYYANHARLSNA